MHPWVQIVGVTCVSSFRENLFSFSENMLTKTTQILEENILGFHFFFTGADSALNKGRFTCLWHARSSAGCSTFKSVSFALGSLSNPNIFQGGVGFRTP